MYELIRAAGRSYYIDCPAKIGLYRVSDTAVWLIDSGNDKEAGKKVLKILDANGWKLEGVVNTHSNADHIGGNRLLKDRTGCRIVSTGLENAFLEFPLLEPSFLYGGYPCKELRGKFLMAQPCRPDGRVEDGLPEGLEFLRLPGHFFDMIGIRTADDVWYLADCLTGEAVIGKYHLSFLYDVGAYLETLDLVCTLTGKLFVPAHAEATRDIRPLAKANKDKVHEIMARILELCAAPACFEDLLKRLCDSYGLTLDFSQYALVGSTVRSYLSYLHEQGRLEARFVENKLMWRAV